MNDQLIQLEQSILQQDSDASIQRNFTLGERHPRVYLGLMIFITALGYGWLLLFPLLFVFLVFYIPYSVIHAAEYLMIFSGVMLAAFAGWVSYAMLRLPVAFPAGRPLHEDEAPVLQDIIKELCRKHQVPGIDRIRIVRDLSMHLIYTPVNGYPLKYHSTLLIGLPLMQSLNVRQLLARIEREIIMNTVSYKRPVSWISFSNTLWCQYHSAWQKNWRVPALFMRSFFSWYVPLYKLTSVAASRMQHYYADQQLQATLRDATVAEMLLTENISSHYLTNDFWPNLFSKAYRHKQPPYFPYASLDHNMRAKLDQAKAQAWLNTDLEKIAPLSVTPSLRQRLDRLGMLRVLLPAPITESAAKYFLEDNLKIFAGQLDRVWFKTHEFEWQQKYQQGLSDQQRLRQLIMQAMKSLLADETAWELLQMGKRYLSDEQMLPMSRQILQSNLSDARIYFDIGRSLLTQDDEQGILALEKAIIFDEGYTVIACQLMTKYFVQIGNSRSAQNTRRRALAFQVNAA